MKSLFAVACTLMFCGSVMAQEATIAAPVAPGEDVATAVQEVVASAADETAVATPVETQVVESPVADAGVIAMPMEGGIVEGNFVNGTVVNAPMYQEVQPMPMGSVVDSGCSSCGNGVAANFGTVQQMGTAPVSVMGQSVVAPSVVDSNFVAAPVVTGGVVATDCVNCARTRPQVVRRVSTRGRSVLTRVRGMMGRRNNCCN